MKNMQNLKKLSFAYTKSYLDAHCILEAITCLIDPLTLSI